LSDEYWMSLLQSEPGRRRPWFSFGTLGASTLMPHYITQKVAEAIEELIGPDTQENRERLAKAALKARIGALPVHRETMSPDTLRQLSVLENSKDFRALREAFIWYVIYTQRDAALRESRS